MGRGSSKVGSGGGGIIGSMALPGVKTAGEISFEDMMAIMGSDLSDGHITFSKVVTFLPNGYTPVTGKKGDLGTILSNYNAKNVVIDTYRDKAGKNDIKRMLDLGYKIQAEYIAPDSGSAIPPKDWYFFVKP